MRALSCACALLLTGCFQPNGLCKTDRQCETDMHCSMGICISNDGAAAVGEPCYVPGDCVTWAECVDSVCQMIESACKNAEDCQSWETCVEHVCVVRPGNCNVESDCEEYEQCTAHACVLAPGRCLSNPNCSAWQYCAREQHLCVDVGGTCSSESDCELWQTCMSTHCGNQAGRCARTEECDPTWQLCSSSTNTCETAPGKCANSADCNTNYQECSSTHVCVTAPGKCYDSSDCDSSWQQCVTYDCVTIPGKCATDKDCAADRGCSSAHECVVKESGVDSSCPCTTGGVFGVSGGVTRRFQTFTAPEDHDLTSVEVRIRKTKAGKQGSVSVALFSLNSSGMPSNQKATGWISVGDIGTTFQTFTVKLSRPSLTKRERYAIVLSQSSFDADGYEWCSSSTGGGRGKEETHTWSLEGGQSFVIVHTSL